MERASTRHYDITSFAIAKSSMQEVRAVDRGRKISLGGLRDKEIHHAQKEIVNLAETMKVNNPAWVRGKVAPLYPYLSEQGKKKSQDVAQTVEKNYTDGLKTTAVLVFRATKNRYDPEDTVAAYTTSFINILRVGQRFDIQPSRALKLAQAGYRLESHRLAHWYSEAELPGYVVRDAALKHPLDTQKYLDAFRQKVQELRADERYTKVPTKVIQSRVFMRADNPEKALDGYLEDYDYDIQRKKS